MIVLFCIAAQYGFINLRSSQYNGKGLLARETGSGGGESVFFHMKSVASGCDFSELHSGDDVEFLLVTNKAKKSNAIHVKKLRCVCRCAWVCAWVCVHGCVYGCVYGCVHGCVYGCVCMHVVYST